MAKRTGRAAKPPNLYRVGVGLDLAYTEKTASDYSVAVVLARVVVGKPEDDHYFVLDVKRAQKSAPAFHDVEMAAIRTRYPEAMWRAYLATSEMGAGQFIQSQ